ncbi:hypothetical protein GCM10009544_06270 [Streptomyces stramineus]|uniref:Secreted protein n=1 Tax=Streptomyces stramineus TaxID=173861 RepID=A0ABP3J9M2_9ACTN
MFVLALDALSTLSAALAQELFEHARPHCGKIGRQVSHRARSLSHWGEPRESHECVVLGTGGKYSEFSHGSQAEVRGSSRCPQGVYKCAMGRGVSVHRPAGGYGVSLVHCRFDRMA